MSIEKILLFIKRRVGAKPAFSLLEMVVSLSIIVVISSMFIANYKTGNKRTDLTMAAQILVTDLHAAQNKTLGLVKYGADIPPGGWGIAFDTRKSSYTLFADLEAPGESGYMEYNVRESDPSLGGRVIDLPPNVVIDGITFPGSDSIILPYSDRQFNVTFLPPDPITNLYIDNIRATTSELWIHLRETRNNTTKTVKVNFLGLAEVFDGTAGYH